MRPSAVDWLAYFVVAATWPLWLTVVAAIAAAVWMEDRGPVLYPQTRLGKDGRPFRLVKFRTMRVDAESDGPQAAVVNDQRITRVGRVLRATAVDELPQLINIWRGEMTLVGPRPERPELYHDLEMEAPGFRKRLRVRPGLTGLAQLRCPYNAPAVEKLGWDLTYIRARSIELDLRLVAESVWRTIRRGWDERTAPTPQH